MSLYLVAFIEYAPAATTFAAGALPARACFAELHSVRNADAILGEVANGANAGALRARDLSPEAQKRLALQSPELMACDPIGLGVEDLEGLTALPHVQRSLARGRPYPEGLRAITEAVRALGEGARLLYWFEHA